MDSKEEQDRKKRYEIVTALFGWGAALGIVAGFLTLWFNKKTGYWLIGGGISCLAAALKRDYARLLKRYQDTGKLF